MKIRIYDWKKLLEAVLIGGAGLVISLIELFQGNMGVLLMPFIMGYLICRGVYESVTETGFRRAKAHESRVKQVYRERFGRFGMVMMWSPVIGIVLLLLLGCAQVPVWILITGLVMEVLYMIWLTVVIGSDLKKYE